MTAEGEVFSSPKEAADAIDASRSKAHEEAVRDAEAKASAPPSPAAPTEGVPEAPPVVTPEACLALVKKANALGAMIAKRQGKADWGGVSFEEARAWSEVAAPCLNDLQGAGEIPYLGGVLRWGAFLLVSAVVFGPPAAQLIPERKPAAKPEEQEKPADVTAVR